MVRAVAIGMKHRMRKFLPLVPVLALLVALLSWFGLPGQSTGATAGRVLDKIDLGSVADIDPHLTHATPYPADMVVSPDRTYAYVSFDDLAVEPVGMVAVVDTMADSVTAVIRVAGESAGRLALSPDGRRLYVSAPARDTFSAIDTASKTVIATPPVHGLVSGIALSPDGQFVYAAANYQPSHTVTVYDATNNYAVRATLPFDDETVGVVVSPNGQRLYVALPDRVSIIDTATNTPVGAPIDLGYRVFGSDLHKIAISPDGRSLYVTAGSSGHALTVIDTATGVVSRPFDIGHGLDAVAVSPDGHRVYATYSTAHFLSPRDYVTVLDSNTKARLGDDIVVGYQPLALAVSRDGRRVFVVNDHYRKSSHPTSSVSVIEPLDPPVGVK